MIFTILYYDRKTNQQVRLEIDPVADVIDIDLPAQEEVPAVSVTVNSDAVRIHREDGETLGGLDYTDLIGDAED